MYVEARIVCSVSRARLTGGISDPLIDEQVAGFQTSVQLDGETAV